LQSATLSLPHLGSTANVREVFKNQCCAGLNRPYQTLRKRMITIFSETFLPASELFKMPLGRLRAFRLKSTTQLERSIFYLLPMVSTIFVPITINGWSGNPQVNRNNLSCWLSLGGIRLHNNVQPPAPFAVTHQVSAGIFPIQILPIILSYFKRQL